MDQSQLEGENKNKKKRKATSNCHQAQRSIQPVSCLRKHHGSVISFQNLVKWRGLSGDVTDILDFIFTGIPWFTLTIFSSFNSTSYARKKIVNTIQRKMFFVFSRAWDKEKIIMTRSHVLMRNQTFGFRAPMLYRWATETLRRGWSIKKYIWHASWIL